MVYGMSASSAATTGRSGGLSAARGEDGRVPIAQMRELVGDGAGWLIAENIPDILYIVIDASCGGIEVWRGQGTSRVRAFTKRERAERAIKNMDRWSNTSSYRVVEYKMSERNM